MSHFQGADQDFGSDSNEGTDVHDFMQEDCQVCRSV